MPASFPTSKKTWTSLVDGVDYPQAAHLNEARDEITAIEAGYLEGSARLNSSASTLASLSVTGGSTLASLNVTGGSTLAGAIRIASTSAIAVRITHSTSQQISSGWTALVFNTNEFVQGMTHSTVTASSQITVDAAGVYLVGGAVLFNSTTAENSISIIKNNSSNIGQTTVLDATNKQLHLSVVDSFSTGETISLWAFSKTTNTIPLSGRISPVLWVSKVGI